MGYVTGVGTKFKARRKVDGRLISRTFATKAEAWAWAESDDPPAPPTTTAEAFLARASSDAPLPVTLNQFIEGGGFSMAHLRPNTIDSYRANLRKHILPRWGDHYLTTIRAADVKDWLLDEIWLKGNRPRKARTVGMVKKVMERVMESAKDRGLIEFNPIKDVKQLPKADHGEAHFLTIPELSKLTKTMDPRFAAYVPLCGFAGLRIGEALALRWRNVDLFKGTVTVLEAVDDHLRFGPVKTLAGRRTVSIPHSAVIALADHRNAQGGTQDTNAFVFPNASGGVMAARNFRNQYFHPAVRAAGLDPLVPHELRHTAVALWIAEGADPLEITRRIGHVRVAFTLQTYGHLFPTNDSKLVGALEKRIAEQW